MQVAAAPSGTSVRLSFAAAARKWVGLANLGEQTPQPQAKFAFLNRKHGCVRCQVQVQVGHSCKVLEVAPNPGVAVRRRVQVQRVQLKFSSPTRLKRSGPGPAIPTQG